MVMKVIPATSAISSRTQLEKEQAVIRVGIRGSEQYTNDLVSVTAVRHSPKTHGEIKM